MKAIYKGIAGALIGFVIGAGGLSLIRILMGLEPWELETGIVVGYLFALCGWLLGVGVWDYWGRGWFGLPLRKYKLTGWRRYFSFDTDHKVIGIQYLFTFLMMMLVAGIFAMFMRTELMDPGRGIMDPKTYNKLMSLHGMFMIAVAITIISGPFGNYIVPLMIGADDMAFPRLNALSYWLTPAVPILLLTSLAFQGWNSGWTGYAPLSVTNETGQVFYNLAFMTLGLSSIVGAVNFLTTVITMRAPGMTWGRLPIFVWSILSTAILSLLATNFVFMVMLMVILDRISGMGFFNPDIGGNPILYQHLFWFYSHPAVYVMAIPGLGITLEVITHFSRKPLFAYRWAVAGFLGIVIMSFTVWAHHMFTSGMPENPLPFMVSTELISIPTGFVFLAALGTIWLGKLWLKTPMLFGLAVIFNFLIGGITGIFLADIPIDLQLQDTFWVVAHFHYTIVGTQIFGLMAAIYYWFPKLTGRMYNERLGKLHFWVMFISFNTTFSPMFWLGINSMNRRVAQYLPEFSMVNTWVTISAFVMGSSFLIFLYNMIYSWIRGSKAGANPWNARTLEWQTSSPPPAHNFATPPEIIGHPYDYGLPGSSHAFFPISGSSGNKQVKD
ncbi:MAG: cbb3-type cytochrome c oxidase subunit I [Anaerolineae bacterium]|nr:cbb3-type cytochrome c oxidase subunit I [Anaerolineae bacterium]